MSSKHEDEEELPPLYKDMTFLSLLKTPIILMPHIFCIVGILQTRISSLKFEKKSLMTTASFIKLFGLLISCGNRRRTIFGLCQYTSDITLMMNNRILALIKLKEVADADAFAARFCIPSFHVEIRRRTKN